MEKDGGRAQTRQIIPDPMGLSTGPSDQCIIAYGSGSEVGIFCDISDTTCRALPSISHRDVDKRNTSFEYKEENATIRRVRNRQAASREPF